MRASQAQGNKTPLDLAALAKMFWEVSRCWNDSKRAIRKGMTVEKAVQQLRLIRQAAFGKDGGLKLSIKANKLLVDIVRYQMDSVEQETEVGAAR